jgi:chaperonin cofactor prefoldin
MPEITVDDVTKVLKDALYITVGAGVIGFQKVQVGRRELTKTLSAQLSEAKDRFEAIENRLTTVEERYEALLDDIEARLPEQARDLFKQSRDRAKDARAQVRSVVGRTAA